MNTAREERKSFFTPNTKILLFPIPDANELLYYHPIIAQYVIQISKKKFTDPVSLEQLLVILPFTPKGMLYRRFVLLHYCNYISKVLRRFLLEPWLTKHVFQFLQRPLPKFVALDKYSIKSFESESWVTEFMKTATYTNSFWNTIQSITYLKRRWYASYFYLCHAATISVSSKA